jgi:hypothetical protein
MMALCCLVGAVHPAKSNILFFTGSLVDDSHVALIDFNVLAPQTVTIQSYGYAGGIADGVHITSGGFAPYAILFDSSGYEITADSGGHCATGTDPITHNCDDPFIVESLGTGAYTLAMSVWDNVPFDGFLPDGFTQTGNPGFTCAEFGQGGGFCDTTTATGPERSPTYAVTIMGSALSTPEPGTAALVLGAAVAALTRRLLTREAPGLSRNN